MPSAAMLNPRPDDSDMYSTSPDPIAIARAWSISSRSPVCRAVACVPSCPRTTKSPASFPVAMDTTGHSGICIPSCIAPRSGASTNEAFMASFMASIFPPSTDPFLAMVPAPW